MARSDTVPSPSANRDLASTEWLAERLGDPRVVPVDGTYFLATQKRDAHAEFRSGHIPGAAFFDVEAISDNSTELPHMLPGTTQFGNDVGALGIGDGDTVIVYDSYDPTRPGAFSAPRVWWTFRVFGAKSVYILDGGLRKWKAEGRPLETGESKRAPRKFTAQMNVGAVALLDDVRLALSGDDVQVVDARSAERFAGRAPEPRPGLRSGHMPRAINLPYERLLDDGRFKSREQIAKTFADAGVDLDRPIITSCGSGVTAAVITWALHSLGKTPKGLYDGSWAEWGSRPDLPVEHA